VLEEYIKELEEDLKIDELNLKDYQLRLPGIKHKWAGRCIRHKLELANIKTQKTDLMKEVVKQLQEQSTVKMSFPVLERHAEKHADMQAFDKKINELNLVVELLEKSEKTLSSASYDMKNIIDIIKLETT
jgi:hypothetical protein